VRGVKDNKLQNTTEAGNADGNRAAQLGCFSSLKITEANITAKESWVVPPSQ